MSLTFSGHKLITAVMTMVRGDDDNDDDDDDDLTFMGPCIVIYFYSKTN